MATGLNQGYLTEPRTATEVQQNILIEIDGRPALDVLMEDIGPELAADLSQCAGVIFAARPVPEPIPPITRCAIWSASTPSRSGGHRRPVGGWRPDHVLSAR